MINDKITNIHLHLTSEERGNHLTNRCLTADVREKGFYLKGWRNEISLDVDYKGPHAVEMFSKVDSFEIDIILDKKPLSNVFTYNIQTKGLTFNYQPKLSQKEVDDIEQPDNVVGSYAVYHTTKRNNYIYPGGVEKNYKSGKAFHIYRPEAYDAKGSRIWCDLHIDIDTGTMTVTVPQDFLDTAIYPVVIDPDIGYTDVGVNAYVINSTIVYYKITMPETGTLTDIWTHTTNYESDKIFSGIYSDDGGSPGVPNSLLEEETTGYIAGNWSTGAWHEIDMAETLELSNGTIYWLAAVCDGSAGSARISSDTAGYHYDGARKEAGTSFPATATPIWNDNDLSIYATYSVGAETETFNSDSHVWATKAGTFNSDSHIYDTDTETATFNSDSNVYDTETKTFNSDSNVYDTETKTFNSDSNIYETETATFNSDSHIYTIGEETETFNSDSHIWTAETKTFNSNSYIYETETETFTSNSHIWTTETETATFNSNSHIWSVETATFNSDSNVYNTETKTFNSDSYTHDTGTETFTSDSKTWGAETSTFTSDSTIYEISVAIVIKLINETYDEVKLINESYNEVKIINENYAGIKIIK